jgi:hypothetical protein
MKPYYSDKWECKHCGKCCLTIPCVFAQAKYGLSKGDGKVCPDLVKNGEGYKCLLIERDAEVRQLLLDGSCDDPKLAHLKPTLNAIPIVREFFPEATDGEVDYILWSETGFPDFWNIPEDGWTATQCLRKQLAKIKAKRCRQDVMELR